MKPSARIGPDDGGKFEPHREADTILYITFDGLLQPLGRSQVLRYLERLSGRGWRFCVLSLERAEDLADIERVRALEEQLEDFDVTWLRLEYHQGGAKNVLQNLVDATLLALDFAASNDVRMTHARSYLGGGVAAVLQALLSIPYLFDIRGYWIDERLEEGRWFTHPVAEKLARLVERELYRRSAGVVSLARPAAEDIRTGRFGEFVGPIEVIPTCVDDEEFCAAPAQVGCVPRAIVEELTGRLVIGFVGSVNASYRVREGFELFRTVHRSDPDARLLCLTGQPDVVEAMLDEIGIPSSARIVRRVPHQDVAMWLRLVDWGLLLLNAPFAKRASMPTKLGEFFATGVRPIVFGCNDEVREWAERSGTGIVLEDTDPPSLRRAAIQIVAAGKVDRTLVTREELDRTMNHFSLTSGVERYDAIYRALLPRVS